MFLFLFQRFSDNDCSQGNIGPNFSRKYMGTTQEAIFRSPYLTSFEVIECVTVLRDSFSEIGPHVGGLHAENGSNPPSQDNPTTEALLVFSR